eukprot:COSAG01_NODE_174_length_23022_cov_528.590978_11_plen_86_part_00
MSSDGRCMRRRSAAGERTPGGPRPPVTRCGWPPPRRRDGARRRGRRERAPLPSLARGPFRLRSPYVTACSDPEIEDGNLEAVHSG